MILKELSMDFLYAAAMYRCVHTDRSNSRSSSDSNTDSTGIYSIRLCECIVIDTVFTFSNFKDNNTLNMCFVVLDRDSLSVWPELC